MVTPSTKTAKSKIMADPPNLHNIWPQATDPQTSVTTRGPAL